MASAVDVRAKHPVLAAVTSVHVRGYPLRVVPSCCLVLPLHAFRCSILFPIASIAFHPVCTVFDASAFTSSRTSYRLLGWVTFVHHSVGKHVRLLLALGYDSLEYFIFYIPLNTLDLVTYFGQYSIFTFFFTKAREHPHTDFRPNGICKPTFVFGLSPAGVLETRHMHFTSFACFPLYAFCTILLVHVFCICGMHFMNMCCAAVQVVSSAAVLLSAFHFELSSPPPPRSATGACRVVVLPLHAFRCSILFPIASIAFHPVCTVFDASVLHLLELRIVCWGGLRLHTIR